MTTSREKTPLTHGNYTGLGEDYAKHRPAYAPTVLDALIGLTDMAPSDMNAADIGAGTGIWSRMLADREMRGVNAVEPNDDMRNNGINTSQDSAIHWQKGSAEATGLESGAYDLVTMASSFHWTDFDKACQEFHRLLKPGGWFCALWNPRILTPGSLFFEIEEEVRRRTPNMKRVSSGTSEFCDGLTDKLLNTGFFDDGLYMEGRHMETMSLKRYLGAWRSVNDIQVQMGAESFADFLKWVEDHVGDRQKLNPPYLTRAWAVRRR